MAQERMIFEHLKKGLKLTPMEALDKFGCFRLSARIFNLRAKGHDIEMTRFYYVNEFGKTVYFGVYRLKEKT